MAKRVRLVPRTLEDYPFAVFLGLILKRLAQLVDPDDSLRKEVFLDRDRRFQTLFWELKGKYERLFPPFRRLHFMTAGAFPYSRDLTKARDILYLSGAIKYVDDAMCPTWFRDSNQVVMKELTQLGILAGGLALEFNQLVLALETIIVPSPYNQQFPPKMGRRMAQSPSP